MILLLLPLEIKGRTHRPSWKMIIWWHLFFAGSNVCVQRHVKIEVSTSLIHELQAKKNTIVSLFFTCRIYWIKMQFRITSLLLAAVALSAEAFAPMSIATTRSSSFGTSLEASDKPLTELCEITKEACDVVSPLLKGTYVFCVERNEWRHQIQWLFWWAILNLECKIIGLPGQICNQV